MLCKYVIFYYNYSVGEMNHQLMSNFSRVSQCACGFSCKDVVLASLGSFLLWLSLYNIIHSVNRKQSAEWSSRIIAGFHGTVSALACFISAFILGPWPFSYIGYPPNPLHCTIIIISLGYFVFDLIWCLYMQTEELIMLLHHLLSVLGLVYVLWFNIYGCEITSILGASEFTNPLLQLRWFMKRAGKYTGKAEILIDCAFFFFFISARVIVGTALYLRLLLSPRMETFAKVSGGCMHCVGVVFSIHLALFFHRKYIKKKPLKND